ncbi:MAG: transglutaminaseTgpA domain-containing protein [Pseudoalteromonas sp.]
MQTTHKSINNLGTINVCLCIIYAFVLCFLVSELPIIFSVLLALLCSWNLLITHFNKNKPSPLLANCLAGVSLLILFYFVGFSDTVTLFVAMLILSSLFKLLQATTKKHYQTITLLSFFSLSTVYLFSQTIITTLVISVLYFLNFAVLALIESGKSLQFASKQSVKLLLLSLPIAVFLLLFLPKLPAFWQLPGPKLAKTGLSESVDPFAIAKLSNSDELVFRAKLTQTPLKPPYYWRALIHDEFNGRTWVISDFLKKRQKSWHSVDVDEQSQVQNKGVSYQIYAEPAAKPWLFGLGLAKSNHKDIKNTAQGLLLRQRYLSNSISYQVQSQPLNSSKLTETERSENLKINLKTNNPQAQRLAASIYKSNSKPEQFYDALFKHFANNGFSYTLSPEPMLGENTIDQFLFDNKRGFCGHYASSAAFMFRSVGIPARVVSGYLGGEYNQQDGYLSVYQYDAHAWVEVYIEKKGWKIFDATAVVSPERLNGSLSEHQQLNNEFNNNLNFGLLRLSNVAAINWIRLKLENLDYQWTSWVLGFDKQQQSSMLKALFGNKDLWKISVVVLLCVAGLFASYFIHLKWSKKPKSQLHTLGNDYLIIKAHVEKQGFKFSESITPLQFCKQAGNSIPDAKPYFDKFAKLYSDIRYQEKIFTEERKNHSKSLVKLIKRTTNTKKSS